MPAKSKAQQKALCAKSSKLCEEFAVSGKAYDKLPAKVKKKPKRGQRAKTNKSKMGK